MLWLAFATEATDQLNEYRTTADVSLHTIYKWKQNDPEKKTSAICRNSVLCIISTKIEKTAPWHEALMEQADT
jgi:hypothetical protein